MRPDTHDLPDASLSRRPAAGPRRSSLARPASLSILALAVGLSFSLAACAEEGDDQADANSPSPEAEAETQSGAEHGEAEGTHDDAAFATAEVSDAEGSPVGTVTFAETDSGVVIHAQMNDLEPGFRGIHIHETGLCEPDSENADGEVADFNSAGGHLHGSAEGAEDEDGSEHPHHSGDLPNLLVNETGEAELTVVTDRVNEEVLFEDEGTAVIVHAEADNHSNIPERYAPEGPDEDTLMAGDAGDRVACGVIEPTS